MTLRAFVVDDEEPARRKLLRFLRDDSAVVISGEAAEGEAAVRGIRESEPDLVFLDVQMAGLDGFDVARAIAGEHAPRIVFVTAYDQYAIRAFDVHAFGYLLKPFDRARFTRVLDDAKQHVARDRKRDDREALERLLAEIERQKSRARRLLIETRERSFFVAIEEIDWLEAERNNVRIHVGAAVHTLRGTVEAMEQRLDPALFVRLNRSALVRIDFIRELQKWFHGEYKVILRSGESLTWTRRFLDRHPELLQKL